MENFDDVIYTMSRSKAYVERIPEVLDFIQLGCSEMNEELRGMFGTAHQIDEMALLFTQAEYLFAFASTLLEKPGFEIFNTAHDNVDTIPIPSTYSVRYWFMRTPWNFRLELMMMLEGYSPYHSQLQTLSPRGPIAAHASFKVGTEEEYANVVRTLGVSGYDLYQHCESSYGRFSYFGAHLDHGESAKAAWALKPRINLRDGSSE